MIPHWDSLPSDCRLGQDNPCSVLSCSPAFYPLHASCTFPKAITISNAANQCQMSFGGQGTQPESHWQTAQLFLFYREDLKLMGNNCLWNSGVRNRCIISNLTTMLYAHFKMTWLHSSLWLQTPNFSHFILTSPCLVIFNWHILCIMVVSKQHSKSSTLEF